MPRGDKGKYTDKQKRKAEHIEEGYEKKGVSKKDAESRAWATVNKESGGGKRSGSARGKKGNKKSTKKGGKKGGKKKGRAPCKPKVFSVAPSALTLCTFNRSTASRAMAN